MSTTKLEGSPRERLLAAANELFYAEGIQTVGIDRVIERAGVAKASLYSTFGSKDELVRAYLASRQERRRAQLEAQLARFDDPRAKIVSIFDLLEQRFADPGYRGCPFIKASAEAPEGGKVRAVCQDARDWTLHMFTQLARDAGVAKPELLGQQLMLLYDGATVAAAMDGSVVRIQQARKLAETLCDSAAPAKRRSRR